MNIHYDLIGTVPQMDCFRESLPTYIARYKAGTEMADGLRETVAIICDTQGLKAASDYMLAKIKEPAVAEKVALGAMIALCARHFYGLDDADFNTPADLIDAIQSMDQELEFK